MWELDYKNTEHWRIDCFELWCWERLLRVPCTARRSNQSILKDTNPEHSLEELMLKLKLQYFDHLMWRADSLEKTLTTEDKMVGWQQWLNGHEFEQSPGDSEGQGRLACCSPWGCKESDMTERPNNHNNIKWFSLKNPWLWSAFSVKKHFSGLSYKTRTGKYAAGKSKG